MAVNIGSGEIGAEDGILGDIELDVSTTIAAPEVWSYGLAAIEFVPAALSFAVGGGEADSRGTQEAAGSSIAPPPPPLSMPSKSSMKNSPPRRRPVQAPSRMTLPLQKQKSD